MVRRPTHTRRLVPAIAAGLAAALFISACGGGDSSSDPGTTTASETVNAAAFKDCILNGSIKVGIYDEQPNPSSQFRQAAADAGAELFEAIKADDGFVFFYVFADSAPNESFAASLQSQIDQLANALADQAPSGGLGETSVQTDGPVVFGVLPLSPQKTAELGKETAADVSTCLGEAQ